jgi:hypothetical protein
MHSATQRQKRISTVGGRLARVGPRFRSGQASLWLAHPRGGSGDSRLLESGLRSNAVP